MNGDHQYMKEEVLWKKCIMSIQNESYQLHYLLPLPRDSVSLWSFRKYEPPLVKINRLMRSPISYGLSINCMCLLIAKIFATSPLSVTIQPSIHLAIFYVNV